MSTSSEDQPASIASADPSSPKPRPQSVSSDAGKHSQVQGRKLSRYSSASSSSSTSSTPNSPPPPRPPPPTRTSASLPPDQHENENSREIMIDYPSLERRSRSSIPPPAVKPRTSIPVSNNMINTNPFLTSPQSKNPPTSLGSSVNRKSPASPTFVPPNPFLDSSEKKQAPVAPPTPPPKPVAFVPPNPFLDSSEKGKAPPPPQNSFGYDPNARSSMRKLQSLGSGQSSIPVRGSVSTSSMPVNKESRLPHPSSPTSKTEIAYKTNPDVEAEEVAPVSNIPPPRPPKVSRISSSGLPVPKSHSASSSISSGYASSSTSAHVTSNSSMKKDAPASGIPVVSVLVSIICINLVPGRWSRKMKFLIKMQFNSRLF